MHVAHIAELKTVHRRGGPWAKERAALVLASRGYGCICLPEILEPLRKHVMSWSFSSLLAEIRENVDGDVPDFLIQFERECREDPDPYAQADLFATAIVALLPHAGTFLKINKWDMKLRLQIALLRTMKKISKKNSQANPIKDGPTGIAETREDVLAAGLRGAILVSVFGHTPEETPAFDYLIPVPDDPDGVMGARMNKLAAANNPPTIEDYVYAAETVRMAFRAMPRFEDSLVRKCGILDLMA